MKRNRRDFLKQTKLASVGLVGTSILARASQRNAEEPFPQTHRQTFNMSGYVPPKLDLVRIGVLGVGSRGSGTVMRLGGVDGAEIKALCDLHADRVAHSTELVAELGHKPDGYSGGEDEWKKVCDRSDIDLIAICTPWHLHTPQAIYAMEHGKHVYTELPAALTIEDCWKLVETSERTRKHCVQMSGNCIGGISGVILNMVRKGFFGEIIHGEGAYVHQNLYSSVLGRQFLGKTTYWRLGANTTLGSGNLYPHHGLVPIIQMMDVNYGDKMEYMCSMSSDDFVMEQTIRERAEDEEFWKDYLGRTYRGNINTSIIRTNKGRTIVLQHDTSSPRPNVRFNIISGTKGIFERGPTGGMICTDHYEGWVSEERYNALLEEYTPKLNKVFGELYGRAERSSRATRGYSRVSPTDWRLIDCLRTGLPLDMDVYEAVVSSAIIPLSIWSVANRSNSVAVPDFTNGAWMRNQRGVDIELERGVGTTALL